MQRIGIFVERHRAWGRHVCEGICAFAASRGHSPTRHRAHQPPSHPQVIA